VQQQALKKIVGGVLEIQSPPETQEPAIGSGTTCTVARTFSGSTGGGQNIGGNGGRLVVNDGTIVQAALGGTARP